MRKIVLLGATAAVLGLGAVNANASPQLNSDASPYAVLVPQSAQPSATTEGRAALVGGDTGVWSAFDAQPDHAAVTREDSTSHFRGR